MNPLPTLCRDASRGLVLVVVLAAFLRAGAAESSGRLPRQVSRYENVLGTSLELKIVAAPASAARAELAALAELDRLSKILSGYDSNSEFRKWFETSNTPCRVAPELFEVLGLFDDWRRRSGGALDASAETASRLWRAAESERRLPAPAEVASAIARIQRAHWSLDPVARTATHLDDAPLVLNSFTKSHIIRRMADAAMSEPGVQSVVVNVGGDLVVRGDYAEPVDLADPTADAENDAPLARLLVRDRAVATSGTYRRGVEIGGRWYSHLLDPRTGRPVDHILSATVVASNATDAGALATAMCVLSPADGARLAGTVPGAEWLLVTKEGLRRSSAGWSQLESARVQLAAAGDLAGLLVAAAPVAAEAGRGGAGAAAGAAWDESFELVVTLELAHFDGARAKRPYVAIWIEDKDKFPVRTIALWYSKPKWLPDLKSWSRADQLRALTDETDLAASVASATRSAGKYTVKWDGKDDKGHRVKPGKYTVFIEVAREHGTHQVMKQEMEFLDRPQQATLPGNVEVSAAALNYRRKADGR